MQPWYPPTLQLVQDVAPGSKKRDKSASHILAIDFTRVLRMISRVRCAYAFLRIRAVQETRVKRYSTQGGKSLSTYGIFPTT
jgi:hypothetical protein